jgi:hypothetical protein
MPDPLLELLSVPHDELPLHRGIEIQVSNQKHPRFKKLTRFV